MTTFIKKQSSINHQKIIRRILIILARVAANITEYHIISKLIFPRINILNFMTIFQVKNEFKNVKNQPVYNGLFFTFMLCPYYK